MLKETEEKYRKALSRYHNLKSSLLQQIESISSSITSLDCVNLANNFKSNNLNI